MKIYLENIGILRLNSKCATTRKAMKRLQSNSHRLGMNAARHFFQGLEDHVFNGNMDECVIEVKCCKAGGPCHCN